MPTKIDDQELVRMLGTKDLEILLLLSQVSELQRQMAELQQKLSEGK